MWELSYAVPRNMSRALSGVSSFALVRDAVCQDSNPEGRVGERLTFYWQWLSVFDRLEGAASVS